MNVSTDSMFSMFPAVSFEEWQSRIQSELKGKAFESLFFDLEPDLPASPYIHPDLFREEVSGPINKHRSGNFWKITEKFVTPDPSIAAEGLNGGVESLLIEAQEAWTEADFTHFLKGVHLEMIQLRYQCPGPVAAQLQSIMELLAYLEQNNATAKTDLVLYINTPDWLAAGKTRELLNILERAGEFRAFYCLSLQPDTGKNPTAQLAALLTEAERQITSLQKAGVSAKESIARMHFSWPLGMDYFLELSKIRAFHILWANFRNAYGESPRTASITAFQGQNSLDSDIHQNMISASTQSMAAVLGGVENLLVLPADTSENTKGDAFTRRIARNLQHILRQEAFLDKVADPAAGSRFIEQLTTLIAAEAWKNFQHSIA